MIQPLQVALCLLIAAVAGGKTVSANNCTTNSDPFYNLFSSITAYDVVRGKIEDVEGCEPDAIWGFIRHGTRYPPEREVVSLDNMNTLRDAIVKNHQKSEGLLCEDDIARLKNWKPASTFDNEMLLTETGVQELKDLGKRLKTYFPKLLDNYNDKHMEIRTSSKTRTQQSAKAVFEGIFGKTLEITTDTIYDELIKNEDNCHSWKKSTHSKTLSYVSKEFKHTQVVKDLQKSISKRLGFSKTIDLKVVKSMYEACRYDYAWYHSREQAPWCGVFTEEDLKILEYQQDLTYYYKSAFGNNYTPKLGCQFIQDIIHKLSDKNQKATLYFGHSITNRKLLVTMGIGKGTYPLKADGYESSADRQWRSSYLTPFAANVFVVRYKCKKETEEPQLAIFVNEHLIPLPGFGDRNMYTLEEFKAAFSSITNKHYCNRAFCHDSY